MHPSSRRTRARATVMRTVPDDLRSKIRQLLKEYHKIPLINFSNLYENKYGEVFVASRMGFDNGLFGFFSHLEELFFELTPTGYMVQLKEDADKPYEPVVMQNVPQKRQNPSWLVDPNDPYLWNDKTEIELRKPIDRIVIALTPYEMVLQRQPQRGRDGIAQIRHFMSQYPEGIALNQIRTKITIDLRLFNTTSINTMVHEYPELFYVYENVRDGEEKIVYDARLRTIDNLDGSDLRVDSLRYHKAICKSITSGIYQKTILLIIAAGPKIGLKLASWSVSYRNNFKIQPDEEIFLGIAPITLMKFWARAKLIRIVPTKGCMNDLRLLLPERKISIFNLLEYIQLAIEKITQQDKEDRWRRIREYSNGSAGIHSESPKSSSPHTNPNDSA